MSRRFAVADNQKIKPIPSQDSYTDEALMALLHTDADRAIEILFRRYYTYTVQHVLRIVPDAGVAEDLGQEVFFELWRKRSTLQIRTAVKAYLRRAATNKALNYLRDNKIVFAEQDSVPTPMHTPTHAQQYIEKQELEAFIQTTIDNLPPRCRVAFTLSRFEYKSHREIADLMGISTKTVEHQIGKALKILRAAVAAFTGGDAP
ncbi:MAG: RNA polymerase sigma-70 factor [Bacteroidota bacterium]